MCYLLLLLLLLNLLIFVCTAKPGRIKNGNDKTFYGGAYRWMLGWWKRISRWQRKEKVALTCHDHNYCDCAQYALWCHCFWNGCFKNGEQVCDHSQSASVFKQTLLQEMAIKWWSNGVKLPISSSPLVIIQQLTDRSWNLSKLVANLL